MSTFEQLFGTEPEAVGRAHGRVNLIGEHTDYNDGLVLPMPIPQQVVVELAARPTHVVRVASLDLGGAPSVTTYGLGDEVQEGDWADYVRGITATLTDDHRSVSGFDASIHGSVAPGAGLGSSGALGVALLRAIRRRFELPIDDRELALLVQRSENEFVGAQVGVMDPLVSSIGEDGMALLIDARDLSTRAIHIPPAIEVVVVDSGTRHHHAASDYNTRRAECAKACKLLNVHSLRDLSYTDLDRIAAISEPWRRRARHVVTENARVLEAVAAIEAGEFIALGELLRKSHHSLRVDYEVSTDAVDRLVALLEAEDGVLGARITGGGFGGAVVAVAEAGTGHNAAVRAARRYSAETGHAAAVRLPEPPVPVGSPR